MKKAATIAGSSLAPPGAAAGHAAGKRTYADALRTAGTSSDALPAGLLPKRRRRFFSSQPGAESSILHRLLQRENDAPAAMANRQATACERFKNLSLQATFDASGTDEHDTFLMRRRSRVIEIVSSRDLVFALTLTGVCAVYSRHTNLPVCYMNTTDDEVVRSLFLNKSNDALITVSVFKMDDFSSLHCRSTPLAHISRGKLDSGFRVFASESLRWPGFVEFDDVNSKVLTFSAEDKNYKVWDLNTYDHLYTINDDRIHEVKISPGIMLLIHNRAESHVPLRIVAIETGLLLKEFNHLLHRNRKVDFIEIFNEKLLVKQDQENLQIVDVRTADVISVARSHFLTPSAFIFLYENQLFLTFRQRQVSVWSTLAVTPVDKFADFTFLFT
jgi:WD40 repeat protein